VPDSYQRYLVNDIRERFDLTGIPIRLSLRGGSENPFHDKGARKMH
jgi:GTP-binding protein